MIETKNNTKMDRKLTYDEMSITQGGNFWDGFCAVVAVGRILAPVLAITGVGLVVLNAATIGCVVYEIAILD